MSIRKSDDALKYDCKTDNGKIVASAGFLDFGITDAITDKYRRYPANFVIVVPAGD